jgi:hypothetical protein
MLTQKKTHDKGRELSYRNHVFVEQKFGIHFIQYARDFNYL